MSGEERKKQDKNINIMKTHKDLDCWKRGIELVTEVYRVTKDFPKDELYGLTNQIRRAAVSIPSNIAEGAARNSEKEFAQFLYISLGSLSELETQFIISKNLVYIEEEKFDYIVSIITHVKRLILGLIKYEKRLISEK